MFDTTRGGGGQSSGSVTATGELGKKEASTRRSQRGIGGRRQAAKKENFRKKGKHGYQADNQHWKERTGLRQSGRQCYVNC